MTDDWQGTRPASPAATPDPSIRSAITWTAVDLFLGVILAVVLVIIISSALLPVESKYGDESPEFYFTTAASSVVWDIGFVLIVVLVVKRTGGGLANLGIHRAVFRARSWVGSLTTSLVQRVILMVLAGYGIAYLTVMLYGVIVTVTGADFLEPSEQLPEGLFDNSYVIAMTGVAVVFGAPIAEEVLFRGFLFGGVRRYMAFWPAALFSGFIFSLAHFNVGLVIPFTLVGAALAWSYERTNSLYTSILVHFLFNLTSFSILVLFPEAR